MHDSQDGLPGGSGTVTTPELLTHDTATEVCLSCHADSYGAVLGSDPLNPPPELGAGNFVFLFEDNLNDRDGASPVIGGHRAGHSIVVPSLGLSADPDHPTAPGGTFPSDELGCTSCHDPHGNENFRLLRGVGPVTPGGFTFQYPAPLGEGVDVATGQESPTSHTAYVDGWAQWCANCHGSYHDVPGSSFDHPGERAMGNAHLSYNQYAGPSDPYGGSFTGAYLPEVPIEDAAMSVDGTEGSAGFSRVMCLSCHRAHGTSAPSALRWDPNVLRLDEDGSRSLSYPIPNPYGDPEQRALCVKCHYPDAVDHGMDQACMACHRDGPVSDFLDGAGAFRAPLGSGHLR
jgi:predicted CXXCH cytochrome family protein